MSRLRCASCQGSFFRSDCESSNPERLDFNGFQAHREKVVQTRPVDLIPCFGLSKKKLRGSIHVLQHSIVHEELVVCRSCDYQCKNLPEQQSSKDSSISWHFVSIEISPALVTFPLKKTNLPRTSCRWSPQKSSTPLPQFRGPLVVFFYRACRGWSSVDHRKKWKSVRKIK